MSGFVQEILSFMRKFSPAIDARFVFLYSIRTPLGNPQRIFLMSRRRIILPKIQETWQVLCHARILPSVRLRTVSLHDRTAVRRTDFPAEFFRRYL